MFSNAIRETPMTTATADEVLGRIYGESFQGDVTMVSTLRCFLYDRMEESDLLYICNKRSTMTKRQIEDNSADSVMRSMFPYIEDEEQDHLYIHSLAHSDMSNNAACIEEIKKSFTDTFSGWTEMPEIENVLKSAFPAVCFINRELKSTVIIVQYLTLRKYHILGSIAVATIPWYFKRDVYPIDAEQRELANSLKENTDEHYLRMVLQISKRFDFKNVRTRKLLSGFETRFQQQALQDAERNVSNRYTRINEYNTAIASLFREIDDFNTKILGLQAKIAQEDNDSEILEYFLCNNHLNLMEVDGRSITFSVDDYLSYFDEDCAMSAIRNPHSFVYSKWEEGSPVSKEDMKRLMYAIFIDTKLKIRTCATYRLELSGGVQGLSEWDFGAEYADCLRNPHIYLFSCMGNYTSIINKLITNHDYIGAIEQCIASGKSLNWTDSTVMGRFFNCMYAVSNEELNRKCIELPDGSIVTPEQAVSWLNEQEGADEIEETPETTEE